MRRTVAALVALALLLTVLFLVTGCGGGGDTTTTTTGQSGAAPPPGGVAAPPTGDTRDTLSPTETITPDQESQPYAWPVKPDQTPKEIQENLDQKQPMMIVYLDSSQAINRDQRTEIAAVMRKYPSLITLVSFDIVAGMSGSATAKDPQTQKSYAIAQALGVRHTPYFLFVDRYARVTWRFAGFVDRGLLEREVLRATQ